MIKEFEVNHLIHREEGRHSVNSIISIYIYIYIDEEERKEGFGDFYSQILELKDEVSRAKTSQKILKKQIDKLKCELKEQFDSLSQLLVIKLQGDNQTQLINFLVPPFLYIDTEEFKHGNSYVKFYKDKITDTRVALKLVQLHMKEELKEELEMVLAEFKNMLKCSNSISCVVTPYQFAYNDDCVGILMEDGGAPLNKYWDLWPFSLEEGLIIFHKLAYGLSTIHQKNIYHGDIKPDNILVKDEYFLFADFGAAVLFNSANDFYVTRNSAGHYLVAYTKAYLAPEIAYFIVHNQEPNQEVKFDKLDIYALVLTIYSLFIKRPINLEEAKIKNVMDPDKYKKFLQIIDTELTNAFTAANCVSRKSKQVIEIMLKCLAFDPRQRPTLTEIVANLNKLL